MKLDPAAPGKSVRDGDRCYATQTCPPNAKCDPNPVCVARECNFRLALTDAMHDRIRAVNADAKLISFTGIWVTGRLGMIVRSAAVSLSIGLLIACGDSDDRGLFAGKGDGGSGGGYSGTGGGSDGGTTSGGTAGVPATGGVAGASTGGTPATGGVAGSGGGDIGGAGGSLGGAGGNTGGGGSGGTAAKQAVACGGDSCQVPGNFCCQNFDWGSYSWKGTCSASGTGCGGSDINCDGPEDCNSFDECCGQIDYYGGQEYYSSFSCVPKGSCSGSDQRLICGSDPTSCPGGAASCIASNLLPGYKACAP
jgi:hypothetical protein